MPIKICPTHGYYRGEECECGEEGKVIVSDNKLKPLGKIVSGALRHFPKDIGVSLDENGWASLNNLYNAISKRNRYDWLEKKHIKALVETDEKGRYELRDGEIRATYGHTVNVKPDLPNKEAPKELYYGSSEEEAGRIEEIGLKPVNKTQVHLSENSKDALEVAESSIDEPVLVVVKAKDAQNNGVEIKKAAKKIWLTDKVPPKYIEVRK